MVSRVVLSALTHRRFHVEFVEPRRPLIIEDGARHWQATSTWRNINHFVDIIGNREVLVEKGESLVSKSFERLRIPFSQFVATQILCQPSQPSYALILLQKVYSKDPNGERMYLAESTLLSEFPALKAEISIPDIAKLDKGPGGGPTDTLVWLGGNRALTPLHRDDYHNLFAQIVGEKRIVLFDKGQSKFLYPYQEEPHQNVSQVDIESPDFKKFPEFIKAKGVAVTLKPGEVLYTPQGHWHYVKSISDYTASVSIWFIHRNRFVKFND